MWREFNYRDLAPRVFSAEECRAIIDCGTGEGSSGYLPTVRECRLFWVHCTDQTRWLFARIAAVALEWNRRYGFEMADEQGALQLARYDAGERYDWHMDLGPGPMSLRKATIVVELAHALEGGGLEIFFGDGRNNRLGLAPGDVAIFPSFIMHRAAPVLRGTRWSLSCWLLGQHPLS
jgi:2-oxoglutarate-Fe(II)-dependent oxygenase superfamily protein